MSHGQHSEGASSDQLPGVSLIYPDEQSTLASVDILKRAVTVPADIARFEGQLAVFLEDLFPQITTPEIRCRSSRGETHSFAANQVGSYSLLATNSPSWKLVPAGRSQLHEITVPRFLLRDVASIEFGSGFENEESSDQVFTNLSDALQNPRTVRFLNLTSAWLEGFPTGILDLTNLESLNLGKNSIESLPAEIGSLKNLSILKLSRNKLTTLPEEIGRLKNLTELHASHNLISELPDRFWNLRGLQLLNLGGNKLSRIPDEICQLTNLKTLELDKNPIPKPERQVIQQRVPNVTIEW